MTIAQATTTTDATYDDYLMRVQQRFDAAIASGSPLFATRAVDLFDLYLESFPDAERQHHNCHACKRFLNRYGGLVTIDEAGNVTSALWHEDDAPAHYALAAKTLRVFVEKVGVTGAFYDKASVWGEPATGPWHHYAVRVPSRYVHNRLTQTPFQSMAEHKEDYKTVWRALLDFNIDHLRTAVGILKSEALYRSERILGGAEWLLNLQERVQDAKKADKANNIVQRAVALAPAGFCHPRSGMIGTLLEDIAAGMSMEQVSRRFAEKMNPTQYQRAQVAPTAGAIQQAEKLFAESGLAPALARRYATLGELPADAVVWNPVVAQVKAIRESGIFSHLQPKATTPAPTTAPVPSLTMTWEKFQRTVLPTAQQIDVQVPASADRFMALVTAADDSAPPILQWDNPFSWYYASGIDAEMRRRLVQAGGRFENVDIRCSLMWNNRNDLDLHAFTPSGHHIFYTSQNPHGQYGWLDVDMNVRGETMSPVENIRWEQGRAPEGRYQFAVNLYATHGGYGERTPFTAEVEIDGQVFTVNGETRIENPSNHRLYMVNVADFHYLRGKPVDIGGTARRATASANAWGLTPGAYAPVTAIVRSPNLWGKQSQEHHGQHAFFLLDGCHDTQKGVGRGFFTEMLRSDLRPVRSVMEAYAAQATIDGADTATACGVGISNSATGDLVVRVTSATGQALIKIDHWD